MLEPEFAVLDAAEERHFWFRSRRRIVGVLARQLRTAPTTPYRVLEIGCGTGGMLNVLQAACEGAVVVGMELFGHGLDFARRRSRALLLQGDASRPPLRRAFHLVGMFDVLEHLEDDLGILRSVRGLLVDGGALLLTVPGHPRLWSYADEASQHYRRYTLGQLGTTLDAAGYDLEYATHFMAATLPLVWANRAASRASARLGAQAQHVDSMDLARDELRIRPLVNAVCGAVLRPEVHAVARRWRLRFGSSIAAIARPRLSSVA
jgi:SAM-dependent methyltransferase